MAGTVVADSIQAASTSTLVLQNGVASTPPTFKDSAGTEIGTLCRAWVNFNGTGTVAIRASFNVTSITDNGTGNYTVNFTTAMPDANYIGVCSGTRTTVNDAAGLAGRTENTTQTTSAFQFLSVNSNSGAATDGAHMFVSIFR